MLIQNLIRESEKFKPKILVIGDLIIDHYIYGSCERISPEAPVPIINTYKEQFLLGGAGNVVNNLKSFGASVTLASVIGKCENANILRKLLGTDIKEFHLVEEKNRITSKKTRLISSNQQVIRFDQETIQDIASDSAEKIISFLKANITQFEILVLSDYNKGLLTDSLTRQIIDLCNKRNVKVIIDPKGRNYKKYTGAYLLTPNKKEASQATQINISNQESLLNAIKILKDKYLLTKSVITLSEQGIAVYDKELSISPTTAKDVYDVTGAGDTVIASIAFALSHKLEINKAIEFANLAAGVVVSKLGSATTTLEEIFSFHNRTPLNFQDKIISINDIDQKLKPYKDKKIVFTNGCFDIIHSGHVKYLSKSKALGELLIVGLNSDQSVKKLKGTSRPVNQEVDRATVLASMHMVDFIIIFDEPDPYKLIKVISPDILTKGKDYENQEVIGSDIVKETVLIDFEEGKSTTNTINLIKSL